MKRITTILLALIAFTSAKAQVNITPDMLNEAYRQRLDSMVIEAFYDKDYSNALLLQQQQTEILRQMRGSADSTYIKNTAFLGRLHFRAGQLDQAIELTQQAITLWGDHVSKSDDTYAMLLDNLSLFLANAGENKAALANSHQALSIYEQLLRNDQEMATILLHCAENSWANGKMDDAVKYELRSLSILKDLYGELSDQYLEELPYLLRFYNDAGDTENAKKLEAMIAELEKKKDHRFDLDELSTPEGCHRHNPEALYCAVYYLDHPANDPMIPAFEQYISKWAIGSTDVNIVVGDLITRLLVADPDKGAPYISAFVAANVEYALKNKVKDIDEAGQKKVFWRFINYYAANRDITGRIALLEPYVGQ